MTQSIPKELQQLNFWSLSKEDQEKVVASIPKQDEWVLDCWREESGYWYFSKPEYGVFNEAFVSGTQDLFDYWYQELSGVKPDADSKMIVTVSCNPIFEETTVLNWVSEDTTFDVANLYHDQNADMPAWLCPMLVHLFKHAPKELYVNLEPTD